MAWGTNIGNDSVSVIALTKDGQEIGRYESISQAARKLFIKRPATIWEHMYRPKKKPKAVKSYKESKEYFFQPIN